MKHKETKKCANACTHTKIKQIHKHTHFPKNYVKVYWNKLKATENEFIPFQTILEDNKFNNKLCVKIISPQNYLIINYSTNKVQSTNYIIFYEIKLNYYNGEASYIPNNVLNMK